MKPNQDKSVLSLQRGLLLVMCKHLFSFADDLHPGTLRIPRTFACGCDAVLFGHEDWITGLHWRWDSAETDPVLLSASRDCSMIIWQEEKTSGVWTSKARLGEMGGANLGFFGGLWGKDGQKAIAHGWSGGLHVWQQVNSQGGHSGPHAGASSWEPFIAVGGHTDEVRSIAWEPDGEYLVSVRFVHRPPLPSSSADLLISLDKTTRAHGPWRSASGGRRSWHELGRPQIHGHPVQAITFVGRTRIVTASDEKVARVFDAPGLFLQSLQEWGASESIPFEVTHPIAILAEAGADRFLS